MPAHGDGTDGVRRTTNERRSRMVKIDFLYEGSTVSHAISQSIHEHHYYHLPSESQPYTLLLLFSFCRTTIVANLSLSSSSASAASSTMMAPTFLPPQTERPSTPSSKQQAAHDSGRTSPEPLDAFHALVSDINTILGPSNGIDSAGVNVQDLKDAMLGYASSEPEWQPYAFADHSRSYTRNLVDAGNGKSNLLILVWTPGKSSPIHDHANAHCVMKILKGQLKETLYAWPCQDGTAACATTAAGDGECPSTEHTCSASKDGPLQPHALQVQRATTYETDQVTYMSDKLGLHRIENPSQSEVAVSLHLYTPPNAAKHGCHIFDESTGKSSHVSQCHFYSELGVKL